jgi:hypothetical protein
MKKKIFLGISVVFLSVKPSNQNPPPCRIIRKAHYPVTQKNPSEQPLRIVLLNLCPENPGRVARPMMPFMINGEIIWREYDIVKVFKNEREARKYAKKNKITDVSF